MLEESVRTDRPTDHSSTVPTAEQINTIRILQRPNASIQDLPVEIGRAIFSDLDLKSLNAVSRSNSGLSKAAQPILQKRNEVINSIDWDCEARSCCAPRGSSKDRRRAKWTHYVQFRDSYDQVPYNVCDYCNRQSNKRSQGGDLVRRKRLDEEDKYRYVEDWNAPVQFHPWNDDMEDDHRRHMMGLPAGFPWDDEIEQDFQQQFPNYQPGEGQPGALYSPLPSPIPSPPPALPQALAELEVQPITETADPVPLLEDGTIDFGTMLLETAQTTLTPPQEPTPGPSRQPELPLPPAKKVRFSTDQEFAREELTEEPLRIGSIGSMKMTIELEAEGQAIDGTIRTFRPRPMLDSGAYGEFINKRFAENSSLVMHQLAKPLPVNNADGTPNAGGFITHYVPMKVKIDGHTEQVDFYVTELSDNDFAGSEGTTRRSTGSLEKSK